MSVSKAFFIFFLSFILGIFGVSFVPFDFFLFFVPLFSLSFLISFLILKRKIFLIFFLSLIFFLLGALRYQIAENNFFKSSLFSLNDKGEIVFKGKIVKEPQEKENCKILTLKVSEVLLKRKWKKIEGKILLYTEKYSSIEYGDIIEAKGELKTPPVFEGFNYKDYLKKEGISSISYFPQIKILEKNKGIFFYRVLFSFKSKMEKTIFQTLSPPQSTILKAIILGEKREIPKELSEKLNRTGLRHIVAVSGLHFAILAGILTSFFISLGFWRNQSFYLTIIFLFLYLLMTGFQPSAVRAFGMIFMFLYGQRIGRLSSSFRALIFILFLMLLFNPFLLRYDVGFQLSFLAVSGIIFLSPFFQEKFKFIPSQFLRDIFSFTLSAQIFTFPILVCNFGYFSVVSLLTNILVLPFIPFLMSFGFLFSFLGIFSLSLGKVLSWPCWLLLTFVVKVIDFFSNLSFSSFNLRISFIWLVFIYFVLGIIVWRLKEKERLEFLAD